MYEAIHIRRLQPLYLTMEGIGPFQDGRKEIGFLNGSKPCNFFLVLSENGMGKTTILDTIAALFGLLGKTEVKHFDQEELDAGTGRAQLDLLISFSQEDKDYTRILTIAAGYGEAFNLKQWTEEMLNQFGADSHHSFGHLFDSWDQLKPFGLEDEIVKAINLKIAASSSLYPLELEDTAIDAPTLLYFSSYRDIPKLKGRTPIEQPARWNYRPVKRYGSEGAEWLESLDNLLVWFSWLGNGSFERAQDIINQTLFDESDKRLLKVQKVPPRGIILTEGKEHYLHRLSSGEKSLLLMLLRIAAGMTLNTLILIDEMDVHLHPRWEHMILDTIKQLAVKFPGITVIATTHSGEILEGFGSTFLEKGLTKNGYII